MDDSTHHDESLRPYWLSRLKLPLKIRSSQIPDNDITPIHWAKIPDIERTPHRVILVTAPCFKPREHGAGKLCT